MYLAAAAALLAIMIFSVKAAVPGAGAGPEAGEVKYFSYFPYAVLLLVGLLLELLAIGSYRRRIFQMRTAVLSGIILLAFQGWLAYDYFTADKALVFKFTAVFPLLAAILDFISARLILRDHFLVESSSRLRSAKK